MSMTNGYAPLSFHNASHINVQNLAMQGPAWAVVSFIGGHHLTIRNCSMRWGQFAGISTGDVPNLHTTDDAIYYLARWGGPGTQHASIVNNLITQSATGLYLVGLATWQSSNHMLVAQNRFIDIDTENFYGNGDCHAIGVQGGSHNLFEHNTIDGAGGITFYQGPDNKDGQPPQEMHDNTVRYNTVANIVNLDQANQRKNQHGIETGGETGGSQYSTCRATSATTTRCTTTFW